MKYIAKTLVNGTIYYLMDYSITNGVQLTRNLNEAYFWPSEFEIKKFLSYLQEYFSTYLIKDGIIEPAK